MKSRRHEREAAQFVVRDPPGERLGQLAQQLRRRAAEQQEARWRSLAVGGVLQVEVGCRNLQAGGEEGRDRVPADEVGDPVQACA
ncbi:MAG: hypothetical protein MUE47_04495 [Acidobacteria bacterium]|nr:hypothetical protein [Acidobacteriota bacterium]